MRCYMINLFEIFDEASQRLQQSLQFAGFKHETIVMDDDGFLPDNVMTPYQFFANYKRNDDDKPAFFNEVQVPPLWEIKGNHNHAEIIDNGNVRGRIFYREHFKNRIVSFVEWFDTKDRLRSVDFYNKDGFKFAETVYDLNKKPILKTYVDRQGKEVLYENFVTKDIILDWQGQSHFFASKQDFISFYLDQIDVDTSTVFINSLATPFFVLYQTNHVSNAVLFWQEQSHGNVPGNMKLLLDKETLNSKVIIPDSAEFESITSNVEAQYRPLISQLGYLYDYQKSNNYNKQVFNLTNSDDLPNLEEIIRQCEDYELHIGAITEMSATLMGLGKYDNVKLYPTITQAKINQLFQTCDIYLDINKGGEIVNAVERAMLHNQLILSYDETAHRRSFIAKKNITKQDEPQQLIDILNEIAKEPRVFKERVIAQQEQNNRIEETTFKNVITNALNH